MVLFCCQKIFYDFNFWKLVVLGGYLRLDWRKARGDLGFILKPAIATALCSHFSFGLSRRILLLVMSYNFDHREVHTTWNEFKTYLVQKYFSLNNVKV